MPPDAPPTRTWQRSHPRDPGHCARDRHPAPAALASRRSSPPNALPFSPPTPVPATLSLLSLSNPRHPPPPGGPPPSPGGDRAPRDLAPALATATQHPPPRPPAVPRHPTPSPSLPRRDPDPCARTYRPGVPPLPATRRPHLPSCGPGDCTLHPSSSTRSRPCACDRHPAPALAPAALSSRCSPPPDASLVSCSPSHAFISSPPAPDSRWLGSPSTVTAIPGRLDPHQRLQPRPLIFKTPYTSFSFSF